MADGDTSGGAGKSKKKNQKRRGKKGVNKSEGDHSYDEPAQPEVDPIDDLKQRLADAKLSKDHALAGKLRQQLWIVQDLAAGVEPRVDPDDLDGQALVRQFQETGVLSLSPREPSSAPPPSAPKETENFSPVSSTTDVIENKRLKALHKKLKQIETLKEKQKKGEKLESNQLEKIKSEASVRQEIQEMEELISKVAAEMKR